MVAIPIADITCQNEKYRVDIYRDNDTQIAVMAIPPGGNIPNEVHPKNTQITTIVEGTATIYTNSDPSTLITLSSGDCIVIPKGKYHMFVNNGVKTLKLYSIYTPPEED